MNKEIDQVVVHSQPLNWCPFKVFMLDSSQDYICSSGQRLVEKDVLPNACLKHSFHENHILLSLSGLCVKHSPGRSADNDFLQRLAIPKFWLWNTELHLLAWRALLTQANEIKTMKLVVVYQANYFFARYKRQEKKLKSSTIHVWWLFFTLLASRVAVSLNNRPIHARCSFTAGQRFLYPDLVHPDH